MNKIELLNKVLRKHFYVEFYLKEETLSSMDLAIFLDLLDGEIDMRDIK